MTYEKCDNNLSLNAKVKKETVYDNRDTNTPFLIAVSTGKIQRVEYLLNHGADINYSNNFTGQTPLIIACEKGYNEIVDILLNNLDCDVEAKNTGGDNPFLTAIRNRHLVIAQRLIERGVDTTVVDKNGCSGLALAVYLNDSQISNYLINIGVSVNTEDQKGFTPLLYAAMNGNQQLLELLVSLMIVRHRIGTYILFSFYLLVD